MTDAQAADGAAKAGTTVLVGKLFRVRKGRGKRFEKELPKEPEQRPSRIALQLAFAHRIQRAIEAGKIRDQAGAARLLGLTRARVSQLLDLPLLSTKLQEQILLPKAGEPVASISERALRRAIR